MFITCQDYYFVEKKLFIRSTDDSFGFYKQVDYSIGDVIQKKTWSLFETDTLNVAYITIKNKEPTSRTA